MADMNAHNDGGADKVQPAHQQANETSLNLFNDSHPQMKTAEQAKPNDAQVANNSAERGSEAAKVSENPAAQAPDISKEGAKVQERFAKGSEAGMAQCVDNCKAHFDNITTPDGKAELSQKGHDMIKFLSEQNTRLGIGNGDLSKHVSLKH